MPWDRRSSALRAPHRNGLEVLRPHDGAHLSRSGVIEIVENEGVDHKVFSRRTYAGNLDILVFQFLTEPALRFMGIEAPEM